MSRAPSVNSESQKELDKVEKQFDAFEKNVNDLTLDRMNAAPKLEAAPQTQLSKNEIAKSRDIYLKPKRTYGLGVNPKTGEREKFNEKFRKEYEFQREYVQFIAENKEIIGESIEMTLKKFPGTPIEDWVIPVNKPVWAPRMVAERISECRYHRLKMVQRPTEMDADGNVYHGQMVSDSTVARLDAIPCTGQKSKF